MSVPGEFPTEEIRFAVVLNGGVSLAVWMGGVVNEIDRLTRRRGAYGLLLDLLNVTARADVIAGTSAGGINGAALALGQANECADVGLLRDLWAEQGRMESLLQRPFRGSPASLLRGDDYFLPKLHEAMRRLSHPWKPTLPSVRPVDLTITTTLLNGARTVSVDSLGQQLPQRQHEAQFRFRRGGPTTGDDFDPDRDPDIAARLAIAARCSAGFPLAFEPCFVPAFESRNGQPAEGPARWQVSGPDVDVSDPLKRPDLGRYVSWRDAGPADEVPADRSRYAVDGGVLENTPTNRALDAISRMPAGALVHRVMLLVYPHAPANEKDPADQPGEAPAVTDTMGSLLGALMSQSSRTFVDEVEEFNRASAARRGTRHDVLDTAGSAEGLWKLSDAIFENYRRLRLRHAAGDLANKFTPPTTWSYERIRQAADDAQREWIRRSHDLPYVPARLPGEFEPPAARWEWGVTAAIDLSESVIDLLDHMIGVVPVDAAAAVAKARAATCVAQADLREVRDAIDGVWAKNPTLAKLQPSTAYWGLRLAHYAKVMRGSDSWFDSAKQEVADYELEHQENSKVSGAAPAAAVDELRDASPNGGLGRKASTAVQTIVAAVAPVVGLLPDIDATVAEVGGLRPWQRLFGNIENTEQGRTILYNRLLWLHVATWTIADDSPTEASLPVDLVQLSLQTSNAFAVYSTTPDDKVGGLSLRRFGGLLKRSWRMNDWTWGRMDAATMLCQIVLSTQRLHRRVIRAGELHQEKRDAFDAASRFVTTLVEALFDAELPSELETLRQEAAEELTPLYWAEMKRSQLPASLPKLSSLAAWAVHLQVAMDELPAIAAAVKSDRMDRANRFSRGELFVDQYDELLRKLQTGRRDAPQRLSAADTETGRQALEAFDRAGIGREPLADEARSDQLIRTAATAASVAVTVADSSRSGLSAIKPVTRSLRGAMLFPYWTVLGLASSGPVARFLALWSLASGAVLLALPLLGVLHGWAAAPATAIGVGALLTAFGFAALRTGTLLHSVVLLTPVIPLLAFAADRWQDRPRGDGQVVALGTLGTILALTLALILLGSLPANLGSPLASLYSKLDRVAQRYDLRYAVREGDPATHVTPGMKLRRRGEALWTWLSLTLLKLLVVVVVAVLLYAGAAWADGRVDDWQHHKVALVAIAAALAVAGWALGYWAGWGYRLWADSGTGANRQWSTRPVSLPEATAATWSVIYGTVFVAVTTWIIWNWPNQPGWSWRAALVTAVVFALLLLYVLPVLVILRTPGALRRQLIDDVTQRHLAWPRPDPSQPEQDRREKHHSEIVEVLRRRDLTFRCLLRAKRPPLEQSDRRLDLRLKRIRRQTVTDVEFTRTGIRLANRVTAACDAGVRSAAAGPAAPVPAAAAGRAAAHAGQVEGQTEQPDQHQGVPVEQVGRTEIGVRQVQQEREAEDQSRDDGEHVRPPGRSQ